MILAPLLLAAAMTSADAVAVLLNSKNATSARTFAAAKAQVEKDAAAGLPLQQFVIGVTGDDKKLAKRYLEASRGTIRQLAEERNNPLAWYLLSMEHNDFAMLQKAVDGGNVQALNAMGTIAIQQAFRHDISTNNLERILQRCRDYFRQAAEQRDPNGFINLGVCYHRGLGCPKDMAMAFTCYKEAAELGHPEGMDYISDCYGRGRGVKRDDDLSLYWKVRARAVRGDEAAKQWLKDRK